MTSISKIILTLAALGGVHALPQAPYPTSDAVAIPTSTATPPTPPPANNDDLIAQLLTKPTAIKRFKQLLTDGEKLLGEEEIKQQTVFDFNNAQPNPGAKGGATKSANIDTFPILTSLGISTTLGFLNPCGLNTPHVHPRATEFLTVVSGTLNFGMFLENGLVAAGQNAEVSSTLNQFQGTVFPMGSIHYQFNPTCEEAVFVATLNSEDPGTGQVAQGFFGLDGEVVQATLGFPEALDGEEIESVRNNIPANIAQAVDTCLAACKRK